MFQPQLLWNKHWTIARKYWKFENLRTPGKNLSDLVSRTSRFENSQNAFFWKRRDLKNTLRKGSKNGSKMFGRKGGTLWSQFFRSPNFDHLPYKSAQKGVLQNRGVDIEGFPPSNEQKNGLFWRFLTKFFSFFKNRIFWPNLQDERPKKGQKKPFFSWKHTSISQIKCVTKNANFEQSLYFSLCFDT